MLRYLIDEQLLNYVTLIRRRAPELFVLGIGEPGAPSRGSDDPSLLAWCAARVYVLVTADRRSMRRHFLDHIRGGNTSPGVLIVNEGIGRVEATDLLVLAAFAAHPDKPRDQCRFLRSL